MFVHNRQRGGESDVFVFTGIPVHAFSVLLSANDSVVNSPLAPSTINLTASRSDRMTGYQSLCFQEQHQYQLENLKMD